MQVWAGCVAIALLRMAQGGKERTTMPWRNRSSNRQKRNTKAQTHREKTEEQTVREKTEVQTDRERPKRKRKTWQKGRRLAQVVEVVDEIEPTKTNWFGGDSNANHPRSQTHRRSKSTCSKSGWRWCFFVGEALPRVARFFLFQTFQTGKNISNDHKLDQKAVK
jgi:hypothetical protein